eukprot:176711_1
MKPLEIVVTALLPFLCLLILCIFVSRGIYRKFHQITNKQLKLAVVGYLISVFVACVSYMVYNITELTELFELRAVTLDFIEFIHNIALIMRFVSYAGIYIFIGYFVKLKLQNVYHGTFLEIHPLYLNILFTLYVISAVFSIVLFIIVNCGSYWNPRLSQHDFVRVWFDSTYEFWFCLNIYYIIILFLFNKNLHKFISLTLSNDQTLANEINIRLKNEIIKQTNLMSLIINVNWAHQLLFLFHWILPPAHAIIRMLYNVFYCLLLFTATICIYLTFNFNAHYYHMFCARCHLCCIYVCTKCVDLDPKKQDLYISLTRKASQQHIHSQTNPLKISDLPPQIAIHETCDHINECMSSKRLCRLLNKYDENGIRHTPTAYDYSASDILNDFHHVLTFHDSADDFKCIYDQLKPCTDFRVCGIFSRNQIRRRHRSNRLEYREFEYEHKEYSDGDSFDIKQHVLDKIHSFYYHSYDTCLRSEDTHIESMYEAFESRRNQNEAQWINGSSKFSSNFDINDDEDHHSNVDHVRIYSFGQRFDYADPDHEWHVEAKYTTLKQELIDNETCAIEKDIYDIEYEKCHKFMDTDQVKRLSEKSQAQMVSEYHILTLLIYCNCDLFQNRWSETYRANKETDTSLKQRHSHFYFCSVYLRELIEGFGERLMDCKKKVFYHGVNKILFLTRTTTQFNGPLSTSTELGVAYTFCGNMGMILQLKYSFSTYPLNAKYFDCAFYSNYVHEKECLFLGGVPVLIITNIINMQNGMNYGRYINALNIINCVLNGTFEPMNSNNNYNVNKRAIELCCALLRYQAGDTDNCKIPPYVANLLNEYCHSLTNIMIFWHNLQPGIMRNMLQLFCDHQEDDVFFDFGVLSELFPNLQQIEYFNNHVESTTQQVVDYVLKCNAMHRGHLKYVIIHRQRSLFAKLRTSSHLSGLDEHRNLNEFLFEDNTKIIIHRDELLDVKSLCLRFNKINIGSASSQMIQNCLQHNM